MLKQPAAPKAAQSNRLLNGEAQIHNSSTPKRGNETANVRVVSEEIHLRFAGMKWSIPQKNKLQDLFNFAFWNIFQILSLKILFSFV